MKSLLLIKPGSFGDVIHALPCAAAVKRTYPRAKLTWIVDDRWEPLLKGNPHIDETIVFPRRSFRGLGALRALPWMVSLNHLRPEVALDLQGLMRSALMARCSGAARVIGLADAREGATGFYHEVTPVVEGEHSVRRYLRTLETLGLPPVEKPEFFLPAGTRPQSLVTEEPFVLLHPFARGGGKSLSERLVAAFCQALAPTRVVVAGMGELKASLPENAESVLNATSIPEMIWLIRAARYVVSVDSGPMHIAAAVTPKLLSIHTWSDPRLVGPFHEEAWIWQGGEIRQQNLATAPGVTRAPETADVQAMAEFVRGRI